MFGISLRCRERACQGNRAGRHEVMLIGGAQLYTQGSLVMPTGCTGREWGLSPLWKECRSLELDQAQWKLCVAREARGCGWQAGVQF